jgi:hypothetical protein
MDINPNCAITEGGKHKNAAPVSTMASISAVLIASYGIKPSFELTIST